MSDNIYLVLSKQMQWPEFVSVYKCTYDGGPRVGFTFYTVLEGLLLPTAAAGGSSNGWSRGKLLGWLRCANHGLSAGLPRKEETRPAAACVVCTTDAVAQVRETSALITEFTLLTKLPPVTIFFFFFLSMPMLGLTCQHSSAYLSKSTNLF